MFVVFQERTLQVKREKVGGLGLSVKGGIEHGLPILVSRIFKDQAADKTGQIYVGDALLKVSNTKTSLDFYKQYCKQYCKQYSKWPRFI